LIVSTLLVKLRSISKYIWFSNSSYNSIPSVNHSLELIYQTLPFHLVVALNNNLVVTLNNILKR